MTTIHRLRATGTVYPFQRRDDSAYAAAVAKSEEQLRALEAAISDYRDVKRLEVLEPFKDLIDRHDLDREPDSDEMRAPSHRGLYWVLSYQWHLLSWSEALRNLFRETISIERKRRQPRFWAPHWAKVRLHRSRNDAEATFEDSNPDDLDALNHRSFTAARNPDFRPPRGRQQLVGIALYNFTHFFARKPFLSALKVAIVLGLVSMPAYFRSTAFFFYRNRGIWVISSEFSRTMKRVTVRAFAEVSVTDSDRSHFDSIRWRYGLQLPCSCRRHHSRRGRRYRIVVHCCARHDLQPLRLCRRLRRVVPFFDDVSDLLYAAY